MRTGVDALETTTPPVSRPRGAIPQSETVRLLSNKSGPGVSESISGGWLLPERFGTTCCGLARPLSADVFELNDVNDKFRVPVAVDLRPCLAELGHVIATFLSSVLVALRRAFLYGCDRGCSHTLRRGEHLVTAIRMSPSDVRGSCQPSHGGSPSSCRLERAMWRGSNRSVMTSRFASSPLVHNSLGFVVSGQNDGFEHVDLADKHESDQAGKENFADHYATSATST